MIFWLLYSDQNTLNIITVRTKEYTQFYSNHTNITTQHLIRVSDLTGPSSGSTSRTWCVV